MGVNMANDPVCKMKVDERSPVATSKYKDKTYYFCTYECKEEFDLNPEKYLDHDKSNSEIE